ncbi:hypothetical protein ACSX1A_19880 [Pontibacter sp. MBLB2868]|uniref:hypothetical protein n=1 Tax=Pontibacter sp. MBLB2868 TaxID=3451555 RepID=UPI003F750344
MKEVLASAILLVLLSFMVYLGKQTISFRDVTSKPAVVTTDAEIFYPPPIEPPLLEYTDSSVIETIHFESLNSTRIFNKLKGKAKVYYRDYYYGTNILREEGTFVKGDYSGVWRCYSPEGKLMRECEYPILD